MNRIALGKKGNGQLLNVDVIISGLNSRLSDSLWDILLVRTLIDFKLNKERKALRSTNLSTIFWSMPDYQV